MLYIINFLLQIGHVYTHQDFLLAVIVLKHSTNTKDQEDRKYSKNRDNHTTKVNKHKHMNIMCKQVGKRLNTDIYSSVKDLFKPMTIKHRYIHIVTVFESCKQEIFH